MNRPSNRLCAIFTLAVWAIFSFSSGCSRQPSDDQANVSEITVAAAANLTDAFAEIAGAFTAQAGVRVTFSFGATADLAKQIENGGPFDVFAAADVEHVDALVSKGLLVTDTRAVYAQGRLVLWQPPQSQIKLTRLEDVKDANVKYIAIAKPDVAPYGRAAIEALRALDLWGDVEPKAVYSQNVTQAKQQAASGNADLAFLPLALVKPGQGQAIEVDAKLYQPINQAMAVVKASNKQPAARRFADFVLSAAGQAILERYGYLKPAPRP
jgi:molybdate transport system substrate-binding protein